MLRSLIAVFVVLLLGAGAAGAYWQYVMVPAEQSKQQPQAGRPGGGRGGGGPIAVEVAEVELAPSVTSVTSVGTMIPNESITIRPEVAAVITKFDVKEGELIQKGAVIVELDSSMEEPALDQAEARLALAVDNLERARELRRASAGTQRSLDEAQATHKIAEAEVKLARARLAKRRLVAPFDAFVRFRQESAGQFVQAGAALVGLQQIDPLKVEFRVPELFLQQLHVGQSIAVNLDAFPGESFSGVVQAIDPVIDQQGRSVSIRAVIANPGAQPRLRPGLFARVNLQLEQRSQALWIPEEALVPLGDKQLVFKVVPGAEPQSKIVKQTFVTLGNRGNGKVEIVSGLERGDAVVSAGIMKVRDGAAIRVGPAGPPGGQQPKREGGAPVAAASGGRPG